MISLQAPSALSGWPMLLEFAVRPLMLRVWPSRAIRRAPTPQPGIAQRSREAAALQPGSVETPGLHFGKPGYGCYWQEQKNGAAPCRLQWRFNPSGLRAALHQPPSIVSALQLRADGIHADNT